MTNLESYSWQELLAGDHFSDLELFSMFSMDCGDGHLWNVSVPRSRYDKAGMSPADLRRHQKAEKAERAAKLAQLVAAGAADDLQEDDCLTDLLESPEWVGTDIPEVAE